MNKNYKMKTYKLNENNPTSEVLLLKEMYEDYMKADDKFEWANNVRVIAFGKAFENFGGFNGQPSDLWLRVIGTNGSQQRTFWRTGFGSKKSGFKVFVYDLRTEKVTAKNIQEIADKSHLKVIEQGGLTYYTI